MDELTFNENEKRVVQERAIELKKEGTGYLRAIRILAEELIDTENGRDTVISRKPIIFSPSTTGPLLAIGKLLLEKIFEAKEADENKQISREERIKERMPVISPWVDEIWNK